MVAVELPPEVTTSFVSEARSYLPIIAESLLALDDQEKLAEAFRFAHTIKSSAAMMGHTSLSQLAELLEGDLEAFQFGEPATPLQLAQLGRSVERLGQLLDAVAGEPVDIDAVVGAEVADRTALLDSPDVLAGVGEITERDNEADDAGAGQPAGDDSVAASEAPAAYLEFAVATTPAYAAEEAATNEAPAAYLEPTEDEAAEPAFAVAGLATVATAETSDSPCHSERSEETEPPATAAAVVSTTAWSGELIPRSARDDRGGVQDDLKAPQQDRAAAHSDVRTALDDDEAAVPQPEADTPAPVALPEPFTPAADASSISTLVDELAETVLALGRDLSTGGADLHIQHQNLAAWLRRFGRAAGLRRRRVPRARPKQSPANDVRAAETQVPVAPTIEAAPAFTLTELDPNFGSEHALRQAIEAELRFQIEEEVRTRLAQERPDETRRGTAIRLGSTAASAAPAPASAAAAAEAEPQIEGIDVDLETREVFALEAAEHLKRIDVDAAALAANPSNGAARAALRRSVHTLKGAAAMMGFQSVATLAHSLEDRLEEAADPAAGVSPLPVGEMLQDLDKLEALVQRCLTGGPAPAAAPAAPLAAPAPQTAAAPAPQAAAAAEAPSAITAVPVRLDHLDDLLRVAGETSVSVAAWPALLSATNGALTELRHTVGRMQSLVAALGEEGQAGAVVPGSSPVETRLWTPAAESSGEAARFDPLELDRYTTRDYLLHDLAEIAADAHSAEREIASAVDSAAELVTAQGRQATEMQERLLAARLIPLDDLASRLNRAAGGVAARRKKQIEFIFTGGDVSVDRAILDSVADALLHLVRNAGDHGIEAPDLRLGRGKPAAGTIHVTARQEQGEVVVEVADDGRGIDPAQMGAAARAAGLDPATLTIEQAVELIFRPGVSTAGKVDDVSGRGVGLDAVREAIERVRGTIEVLTEPGHGTIFSLRFPVTLAQARVVMAEVAGNPLALPASSVRRVTRLGDLDIDRSGGSLVARLEGETYAVADLASILGLAHEGAQPENPPVLFVEAAGKRAALIAGAIGSQRDVVIKPLGSHLHALRGVSGAALLQDGRVALLLHLPDVLAGAATIATRGASLPVLSARSARSAEVEPLDLMSTPRAHVSLQVLVVDDSPTIRKLLVRTLKDLGWRTAEAKDGVEALERIRVARPDVVLSDIEMPHLDGYALLSALRAKPETVDLPVVMLTSRTAERHRQRATELGANGYLTKPYRPSDVVAALRQVGFGQDAVALA